MNKAIEIYNESMELITDPNIMLGWLENATRIEHHNAIEGVNEVWHYETVREYPNGGKDVRKVIDVHGVASKPEWDETIDIQIYHPYTQEELDKIKNSAINMPIEERIMRVENLLTKIVEKFDLSEAGTLNEEIDSGGYE